jgi:hypothetical protein
MDIGALLIFGILAVITVVAIIYVYESQPRIPIHQHAEQASRIARSGIGAGQNPIWMLSGGVWMSKGKSRSAPTTSRSSVFALSIAGGFPPPVRGSSRVDGAAVHVQRLPRSVQNNASLS